MADLKIQSILIVRLSSIGDIILTTPLVRALSHAFPGARIDYVLKKEYYSLIRHHPAVSRVYGLDTSQGMSGLWQLIKEIRGQRYDLILDLHVNPRSILIRELGRPLIHRHYSKLTLKRQMLRLFNINLLKNARPVLERYFSALDGMGIRYDMGCPELYVDRESEQTVETRISAAGMNASRPIIGLAPGASYVTKHWPAEGFVKAGNMLAEEMDADIMILGGRHDLEEAGQVEQGLQRTGAKKVLNLCGELALLETAAAISKLGILISNDSGLMHMATALDTPVTAVFGPTSRELGFFPCGPKAQVVEAELDCRPCSLHGDDHCPKDHFRCMQDVTPESVVLAAKKLLKV